MVNEKAYNALYSDETTFTMLKALVYNRYDLDKIGFDESRTKSNLELIIKRLNHRAVEMTGNKLIEEEDVIKATLAISEHFVKGA